MAELKASEQGLKQIKQARNQKGWIVEDPRWLVEASKILDPKRDWQTEDGIYASGVSSGTWKAFLYNSRGKGISTEVFKAYCQVLGIAWEEVIEQTIENPGDSLQANGANQLGERFSKAVAQLGSSDTYVRLSGIYALEQIAKDAEEKYYWQVVEILTLYVRKRSPWNQEAEAKAKADRNIPPLPNDIQQAMTVLARRKYGYGHPFELHSLDLRNTDLRRLELPPKAQLGQVNFSGSNLQKATLKEVDLQKSNLSNAILQGVDLKAANLQEATLWEANLQGAILWKTNFYRAQLVGSNLQQARLAEANLKQAILWKANLRAAILLQTELHKTRFKNPNLEFLPQHGPWDVVGLTWEQLRVTACYDRESLPDYLLMQPCEETAQSASK